MNDAPELELVDLGDAKLVTKGFVHPDATEDSNDFPEKPLP